MSAATFNAAVTPRVDFCRRCGDPVSNASAATAPTPTSSRCRKCGGASAQPRVRESEPPASSEGRKDPWQRSYVSGSLTLAGVDDYSNVAFPSVKPASSHTSTPRNAPLALGVPSSISRDLRTPPPPQRVRVSSDASMPTLQAPDGQLSKVVGTLLAPEEQRKTWKCAGCDAPFARDATLFAAPAAASPVGGTNGATTQASTATSTGTSTPSQFFCQACYAQRFSLGMCPGCRKSVLGLVKEEGKFVRAGDDVWHGRCWLCSSCGSKDKVMRGMDGLPVCEECFDEPKPRRTATSSFGATSGSASKYPVPTNRRASQDLRNLSGAPAARTAMGASIAALSARFSGASIASGPPIVPPSPQLSPLRTGSSSRTKVGPPPTWSNANTYSNNAGHARPRTLSALASASHAGRDLEHSSQSSSTAVLPPSTSLSSVHSNTSSLGRTSSTRSLSRNNSFSRPGSPTKPRPLTAQFTGEKFDLAAFRSSQAGAHGADTLSRQDSRSRQREHQHGVERLQEEESRAREDLNTRRESVGLPDGSKRAEPAQGALGRKQLHEQDEVQCAACGRSPFCGGANDTTVEMVTLSSSGLTLHAKCFRCAMCNDEIDGSRSFVRLADQDEASSRATSSASHLPRYAHPACAPLPKAYPVTLSGPGGGPVGAMGPSSGHHSTEPHHVTHQSAPRPSLGPNPLPPAQKYGYISSASSRSRSTSPSKEGSSESRARKNSTSTDGSMRDRRFHPTSGAAPPTRSTLDVQPPSSKARDMRGIFSANNGHAAPPAKTSLQSDRQEAGAPQAAQLAGGTYGARKLGGLLQCAGCSLGLTSLESVPGPRGTSWHRGCLCCGGLKDSATGAGRRSSLQISSRANLFEGNSKSAALKGKRCGKLLDSAAKVNAEGQVRCSDCWSARI